jgi:type I restriction enzyme S subunit
MTSAPTDVRHTRHAWLVAAPRQWEIAPLKSKAEVRNGATPSSGEERFWDGDIPWATPVDLGVRELRTTGRSITQGGYESCGTSLVPAGSLIVSTRAPIGSLALASVAMCFNQGCRGLVPGEGVSGRFLYYALSAFAPVLQVYGEGTTFKELSASSLADLALAWPSHNEQIAIASYLDAETARIDRLIDQKQQLCAMLAELRGGVIRERTTGADLSTRQVATGDVFMPQLPVGWDLVPIGRYSRITNGSTPLKDNPAYWQGGHYPWLNSAVVNRDEVTEGSELVTSEALRQCHLPIVPSGSVLVALTGQGKTRGQATVLRIEATINQHLAAIICDEDHLNGEFVFWALTGQYAALRMVSDGQGGTKGALTCDELGRFRIPKPPIQVQRSIAKALYEETRRIDDLLDHVGGEIRLLLELRAATITDAVLGRIDVRSHMMN